MWLAFTVVSSLALGFAVSWRIWRADDSLPPAWAERALYSTVIGVALWLSSTWVLALLHQLNRPALLIRSATMAACAVVLLWRFRARTHGELARNTVIAIAVVVVPLLLWIQFCLWRGLLLAPVSFDALSYHLPTAILYEQRGGYDALRNLRFILGWRPANYELLLADAMISDGTDAYGEGISTFFFVAFLVAAAALVQRWWRSEPAALAAMILLTASSPVLLLHSADFKNDVMTCFFCVAGLVALGRWISSEEIGAAGVSLLSFGGAVGTKTHAAVLVALAVPVLLWPAIRKRAIDRASIVVGCGVAAFLVLGGAAYVAKAAERFFPAGSGVMVGGSVTSQRYGQWENLWKGPYLLLAAPFSPKSTALAVPWERKPWVWSRFELYYSELGLPFALSAVAMPLCIARFRRSRERLIVTLVAWLSVVILLPIEYVPGGRFALMLPRFILYILPVTLAWTVPPLMEWVRVHRPALVPAVLLASALVFAQYAIRCAKNDVFAPLGYVLWAREHRGTRDVPLANQRASSIALFDRTAGERDHVLLDVDTGSLIYLAFGATHRRTVDFIPPGGGAVSVPPAARWIVVDRVWSLIWGHKDLKDLRQAGQLLGRGQPSDADLRVLRTFWKDRRFELIYFNPRSLQAVFRRRP